MLDAQCVATPVELTSYSVGADARERHPGTQAAQARPFEPDRSAEPVDEPEDDRQPEAAAASFPVACVVEPGESLEDPFAVALGDSRVRRPTRRGRRPTRRPTPDLDRGRRVTDRVVEQVDQDPAQVLGSAAYDARVRPGEGDRHPGTVVPAETSSTTGPHVDALQPVVRRVLARRAGPASAGPRPARSSGAPRPAGRPTTRVSSPSRSAISSWACIEASGLRSSWAASATNDRCAGPGCREPVEHGVQGDGQRLDLVAGGGDRQPQCPGRCPRSGRRTSAAPRRGAGRRP